MTYRPKYFALAELVAPAIFKARGDRAWELLQPAGLMMLDSVREHFGPITVNNWMVGGPYEESGLRVWQTDTGAEWSFHKWGGAYDMKFKLVTPQEAHAYILAHPEKFPQLTTLENIEATPTWVHGDVRNHNKPGIWVVNP